MAFKKKLPIVIIYRGDGSTTVFVFNLFTDPVCVTPPSGLSGHDSLMSPAFNLALANLPSGVEDFSTDSGATINSVAINALNGNITVTFAAAPNNTNDYRFFANLVY